MNDFRIENRHQIPDRTGRSNSARWRVLIRVLPYPVGGFDLRSDLYRLSAGLADFDFGLRVLNFEHFTADRIWAVYVLAAQARIELVTSAATGAISDDVHIGFCC